MTTNYPTLFISIFISHLFISGAMSVTFTIINKCDYTVWPGILSNADSPPLSTTGFTLQKGESKTVSAPSSWGGRMWARTHCSQNESTGEFSCLTGDCGSTKLECSGSGATPPATLAEFKLDGYGGSDYYDVSLVDGYNLPMLVVPQGGSGRNCTSTGCVSDLNSACPNAMKVVSSTDGMSLACKSACEAFKEEQYCCNGAYATPDTCKPTLYSEMFKSACPHSYSYAYDDKTSTFTCVHAHNYLITFCPSPNTSQKSSHEQQNSTSIDSSNGTNSPPLISGTMIYEGGFDESGASRTLLKSDVIRGIVTVTILGLWHF